MAAVCHGCATYVVGGRAGIGETRQMDSTARSRRDWGRAVLAGLGLLLAVRVLAPQWKAGFAPVFPDSWSYIEAARPGPFSGDFWFGQRPPGMSIVLWLLDSRPTLFVVFQSAVYIVAFVALADRVRRTVSSRLVGWLLAVAVMSVAFQSRFAFWNGEILTESLSISLAVLAFLAWWRVIETSEGIAAATWVTLAWLLLRDAHVVPVALIGVVVGVVALRVVESPTRRVLARSSAVLLVLVAYTWLSQNLSERNQYGLMNNVGMRILPDAEMTEAFVAGGMPDSPILRSQAGSNAWVENGMLTSPDLVEFRDWVHGSGQIQFVGSLVTDAPFWAGELTNSLDGAWTYRFVEYDRFGAIPRLADPLPGVGGPRSNTGAVVIAVFLVTAVGLLVRRRRRGEALLLGTASVVALSELAVGSLADAFEVQRHLVGGLSRVSLLPLVALAMLAHRGTARERAATQRSWTDAVLAGSAGVGFLAAVSALEYRSQDWDPAFARTIVERVGRFGGTFYENGIWHHGPLDAVLYDVARWVTTFDTYWFALAAIVIGIAVVVAMSALVVARSTGAAPWILPAVAVAVTLHLSVSSSDYAGVIYSRNVSTALVAVGFALVVWERPWHDGSRAPFWYVAVAALGGLSAQTMLASSFSVMVLLLFLVRMRGSTVAWRRPVTTAAVAAVASVATAPAWYLLRGAGSEFWQNWWVMGRHMNSATGLSLMAQVSKGYDNFVAYYGDRLPLMAAVVAGAASAFLQIEGDTPFRVTVRRFALLWLVAGWAEMVASQRYSSHYYVVTAVPTIMLLASCLAVFTDRVDVRRDGSRRPVQGGRSRSVAVAVASVVIWTQCTTLARAGVESLGRFRGVEAHAEFVRDTRRGATKNLRAMLDLVSADRDPLLAWTMFPWTYLEVERVPATRLSWKSFMLGEIYLARASPEYVLPDTWMWFEEDMDEANPAVYVRPQEIPFVDTTPFADRLKRDFVPAYSDDVYDVWLRADVARELSASTPAAGGNEPVTSGSVSTGSTCSVIEAKVTRSQDPAAPIMNIVLESTDEPGRIWSFALNNGYVATRSGESEIHRRDVTLAPSVDLRVMIGPRSAALIGGKDVLAAVSHDGSVITTMTWDRVTTGVAQTRVTNTLVPEGC